LVSTIDASYNTANAVANVFPWTNNGN